jgi:hypothetical protein
MYNSAKISLEFVHWRVLEAAAQHGDIRVGAADVVNLGPVGCESGDAVPGGMEEPQHAAHPRARIEHRQLRRSDPLDQLLRIAELGAVEVGEADLLGRRVGIVEVPVVQEVAGEHSAVELQLGVAMDGRDAAVHPSAAKAADDVVRKERAGKDTAQSDQLWVAR